MQQTMTANSELERLQRRTASAKRELAACRLRQQKQLELAAKVHRSLLPKPLRHERIDIDLRYIPIEQVGGDYCQVRFSDRQTCFITMLDVTGHGMGAALLATRASSEVRYGILYGREPRDIVRSLNTFIFDHFDETGLYLTFVAARIDLGLREITWCGAGHPSPLLIRRHGAVPELLASQNPMVGVMKDILDVEPEHTVSLEQGDRLLFYTDGLTETADEAGRQLGTAGLAGIAARFMSVDLFEMADSVLDQVAGHEHGPTTDDKTLIVAEVK